MVPRPAYNFSILNQKYRQDTIRTMILLKFIFKDGNIVLEHNRVVDKHYY